MKALLKNKTGLVVIAGCLAAGLLASAVCYLLFAVLNLGFDASASYPDLEEDAWYEEGVAYVLENGIMNGTGDAAFEPDAAASRSMVVTILYRQYCSENGTPELDGASAFTDVESGAWYEEAVIWAEQNGIAKGYDNGEFGVSDNVTREQMAAFFYRYAGYCGKDISASVDLSCFPDAESASSWTETELSWAVAEGLISGVQEGKEISLAPGDICTRAMTATILYRLAGQ